MRTLALALAVVCSTAWAESPVPTPADAPVKVAKGSVVPFDGVLDTHEGYTSLVRSEQGKAAALAVYEKRPPVPVTVVVAVVAAVVGAAIASGVTYVVVTRPP